MKIKAGECGNQFLAQRWLVYLGTISYGLYVYHYIIVWIINHLLAGQPAFLQASSSFIITIAVSAMSYELMEKRFINMKDKYFPKQKN